MRRSLLAIAIALGAALAAAAAPRLWRAVSRRVNTQVHRINQ